MAFPSDFPIFLKYEHFYPSYSCLAYTYIHTYNLLTSTFQHFDPNLYSIHLDHLPISLLIPKLYALQSKLLTYYIFIF